MTMYHMAMPPHLGGPHPPTVHSPLFPSPILPPPMAHSYAMHAFPQPHMAHAPSPAPPHTAHLPHSSHQSHPGHPSTSPSVGVGVGNSAMLTHPSPMLSQPSPVFPPQTSVYVNPYLSHPHQHPAPTLYAPTSAMLVPPQPPEAAPAMTSSGPVMSVDEELMDEMNTLHLGYIETEDSPHKLEQREKLERVIMEYLAITPQSHKFMFHQIADVLESSVNGLSEFSAISAACAFDSLAQYAANLIAQPWRREYRQIKLYSGFWIHQVARHLTGGESILSLMGYVPQCSSGGERGDPACLVMEGVLDPDLISRLALDCLIAYCECQVLKKISEGVREFGLTWRQILQFRQLHVGGVDVTVRHLLFTLRQRLQPPVQPQDHTHRQVLSSGPPLPARQSSSVGGTPPSPALAPPQQEGMGGQKSGGSGGGGSGGLHQGLHHLHHPSTSPQPASAPHSPAPAPQPPPPLSYTRSADTPDTGKSVSSLGVVAPLGQVPTAKLIDLDSCHEAQASPRASQLLPKVLPHKRSNKVGGRVLPPLDMAESCAPPPPPPEVFQAGTLEEHLEATLSLVKDPIRAAAGQGAAGVEQAGGSSWETWEFVYRGLEKRGYSKDIGDRGDILHQLSRHNLHPEPKNNNLNNNINNSKKDMAKAKPLSINQALQALALNETRERVERPAPSSKSSHSACHAGPDVFPSLTKRNSLYDNLSAGFETAPQDSDDYEERRPTLKKTSNLARAAEASKAAPGSSPSPRSLSLSSKSSHSRHDAPSDPSRSTTIAPTLQQVPAAAPSPQPQEGGAPRDERWSCTTCTFLNDRGRSACDMCGKSRMPGPEARPLISGGRQCPQCTLINEREAQDCSACGVHLEGSSTYI